MCVALRKSFRGSSEDDNLTASVVKNREAMKKFILHDRAYQFLQPVRGTPPYWQRVQLKLLAAIKQLGIFTLFFTLSAADMKWHDTLQSLARQQGITISDEEIDNMSWDQKCNWLRTNPVTTARHFQYRLECLMKDITLSDAKPLGEVLHFFYRIEFQQRGSPHAHGVLWIKDAPNLNTDDAKTITNFVDKYISAVLPLEQDDPELFNLVTHLQRHTHSAACKK